MEYPWPVSLQTRSITRIFSARCAGRDGNGVPAAKLKAILVSEIVLEILWTKSKLRCD